MTPDPANANAPRLDVATVFTIARSHLKQPLAIALEAGLPPATVRIETLGDPHWLAGEILRLALIGAVAETEHPDAPVSLVLKFANHLLERR